LTELTIKYIAIKDKFEKTKVFFKYDIGKKDEVSIDLVNEREIIDKIAKRDKLTEVQLKFGLENLEDVDVSN